MPLVSIVIPVYNTELHIRQCLDSIVGQDFYDIEIICVDDGSTDASLSILQEYAKKDSRIIVISCKHSNAGKARNEGLKVATGKYIIFIDSDDYMNSGLLSTCYEKMEEEKSDLLVFAANQYDMKSGETKFMPWSLRENRCPENRPFSPCEMSQYLFNAFQSWPWNKMYRRSLVEDNEIMFQEIPRTNDMKFVYTALALADKISIINKPFITYRTGTGTNLQATNHKSPLSFWLAYTETKAQLENLGLYSTYEQSFLNTILGGSLYNLHSLKDIDAKNYVSNVICNGGDYEFGLLQHDEDYYYDKNAFREYVTLCQSSDGESYQYGELKNDYDRIINSISYRLGFALTWLPRKMRAAIKGMKINDRD